jgi:hypothetical protein
MAEFEEAAVSDEEIDMITFENSCRFFDFDPFSQIAREDASVGALRALATDVDTSVTTKDEFRRRYEKLAAS